MKKILFIFYFTFSILHSAFPQDSCSLRISLLTCSPGSELYSTFGHTAIRVTDSALGSDEVYNYGTFEFTPDFNYKFVKGRLLYSLSVENFNEFLYEYQLESRSAVEQVLALSCLQKQKLYTFLRNNAQPENRFYHYDFLFDNCTTRAKNAIAYNNGDSARFKNILPKEHPTFRNLIHEYLNKAHQDWSKLGIDLLLGAKLDRKVTNEEAMFLPDNLLKGLDSATLNGASIVKEKKAILIMPNVANESLLFTPIVTFSLFLIIIGVLSFLNRRWANAIVTVFDFLFFFILGATGVLMLFMWFGTDHALCANNYNLVWALPTHLVMAFFVHKKATWVKKYFRTVSILTLLLLITWAILPQQLNIALIPLLLLIVLRSWMISN